MGFRSAHLEAILVGLLLDKPGYCRGQLQGFVHALAGLYRPKEGDRRARGNMPQEGGQDQGFASREPEGVTTV